MIHVRAAPERSIRSATDNQIRATEFLDIHNKILVDFPIKLYIFSGDSHMTIEISHGAHTLKSMTFSIVIVGLKNSL